MLFIVFVENGFKHLGQKNGAQSEVSVSISTDSDNNVTFLCSNTIDESQVITNNTMIEEGGIGLGNVRNRLQLLYPEQHTLQTKIEDGTYQVSLTIRAD
ncbi:MAG: GHKL domain-containing protein [Saprospiraceae bacterium]